MKSSFSIRDYREGDFPQIAELWAQTGLGGGQRGDNAEVIQRTLAHDGVFLVMEVQSSGAVIGSSWMTNDGRRIYLHHFGIAPDHQGQGLGKALLRASLERARAHGLQVKLEVHQENQAAIALYKGQGFAYLGEYDSYIIREIHQNPPLT